MEYQAIEVVQAFLEYLEEMAIADRQVKRVRREKMA